MPILTRLRQAQNLQVPDGANLMTALQEAGVPVASSCGGAAVCGKCALKVISGNENLTPPNEDELFLLEKENLLGQGLRISCQCEVRGDVTLDAPYW